MSSPLDPAASHPAPPWLSRRAVWHTLGVVFALALAWLVFLAYRQPDILLELSSMSLC